MKWLGLLRYLTLQIEVTTSCNLDCKICMRHYLERPASSLSLDDFKKVLASGNFRYVGLHGWGEPMLNRQLFEMIGYAESSGVFTNLTTNGTLIGDKIDDVFASGLREIAFGIYDRELFLKSLPRIKELVREKNRRRSKIPKTYLDITIYKENLAQIPELVGELAPEAAVDAVILHRLFNVHKVDPSLEYISVEEEDELFDKVRRLARTLKLEIYLPPKHSFPCRIVKRSIFVTAEGKVTPCCFLPEFYVGNAFEEGIQESMRSKAYTEFVRNMKKHPICSQCHW